MKSCSPLHISHSTLWRGGQNILNGEANSCTLLKSLTSWLKSCPVRGMPRSKRTATYHCSSALHGLGADPPDPVLLLWMAQDGELLLPIDLQESWQLNPSYISFFLFCGDKGELPATACGASEEEEFSLVWTHWC